MNNGSPGVHFFVIVCNKTGGFLVDLEFVYV